MTRDEWRAFAESTPATRNLVGAIRREFERLGFGEAGRAERLWITGQLAQAPGQLATTHDLTTGQAGRVVGAMTACTSLQDLYAGRGSGKGGLPAGEAAGPAAPHTGRAHQPGQQIQD